MALWHGAAERVAAGAEAGSVDGGGISNLDRGPYTRRAPYARLALYALIALAALAVGGSSPASALVRFGPNVFIGGHDFSHQTFGPGRRAIIYLYPRTPRHAGCRWHADGRGGRVKVCHLRRL